jgi:hypothetical protein
MFAFKRCLLAAGMLLLTLVQSAGANPVPGAGRLALLQLEAGRVTDRVEAPSREWIAGLAVAFTAGILSSFLGTYFGMRRFSFGRLREKDGWREVTYRFRSTPMGIKGETLAKMTGILEELERLGKGIRGESVPAAAVEPVVKFARAESPRRPAAEKLPAASAQATERAPRAAQSPPQSPQPAHRTGYGRARALLEQGFDLETVRAMTGLKRAEIDLLRCARTPSVQVP